ncbi:MAG: histidine phosphatase family protein, partial [Patescibacteria group bacterium]
EFRIRTSKDLRGRSYGTWEGRCSDEYKIFFQNIFDKLAELSVDKQKKLKLANDIESDDEIMTRFMKQLRNISAHCLGQNVLIVSHGGPIRNLLMYLGFAKYGELQLCSFSNAGYIKVLCDGNGFIIQEVNGLNK